VSLERDRERARDLQEICDIQEKAQREMGMDISLKSLRVFEDISTFILSSELFSNPKATQRILNRILKIIKI